MLEAQKTCLDFATESSRRKARLAALQFLSSLKQKEIAMRSSQADCQLVFVWKHPGFAQMDEGSASVGFQMNCSTKHDGLTHLRTKIWGPRHKQDFNYAHPSFRLLFFRCQAVENDKCHASLSLPSMEEKIVQNIPAPSPHPNNQKQQKHPGHR